MTNNQLTLNIDKHKYFELIDYKPHKAQQQYHNSKARFRIPTCGRRAGKTTMAATDREPDLFKGKDIRGWIIGPTYNLAEKEFRVMWNHLMVDLNFINDKRTKKAYNIRGGEMYIEMPWGSRVEAKSATNPESLVGDQIDFAIMSEAAKHKHETWERYIRPSLFDRRGGADFPSTAEGYNWYYDLWRLGQDPDKPLYESWRFPSWINHYLFPDGEEDEEIQTTKETTTEEWFAQEIAADFASFVGRIYGEFQVETHCTRHTFQPDWPNYLAVDPGYTNPAAFVEFQIAPNDTIYVWREHYKSFMTMKDHIAHIKTGRENPPGYHLDMAFSDAADPEAAQLISQELVPCVAMDEAKNWRVGVELMKRFMKEYHDGISYDEYERPILRPKYYVDHSCTNHIRELQGYRRKDTEYNTNDQGTNASSVVKKDDHTENAMRYGLMHLFELGANTHLEDVMPAFNRKQPDNSQLWTPRPTPVVESRGRAQEAQVGTGYERTFFSRGMRF